MSAYNHDQQQWHQHSQTSNLATGTTFYSAQSNGQQRSQANPVLNQAVNNIVTDLKSNMDKEYFKTTDGLLSSIEVIASLIIFIIASNLKNYNFLILLTGFAFWIALGFLFINLFQVSSKLTVLPWIKVQMGFCGISAALFLLESIVLLFYNGIMCLFVLHLAGLYGYHSYDKLKEYGRNLDSTNQEQLNPQPSTNLNV